MHKFGTLRARTLNFFFRIQIGCRNALIAWTNYLESLPSRKSFEKELETKTNLPIGDGSCCGMSCPCLTKVTKACIDGLQSADSILFTTYLEGGNGGTETAGES